MIRIPKGKHRGQKCYIIGSGPSIKNMDLSALRDEITVCVNESYKAIHWEPTYICIGDRVLWPKVKEKYASFKTAKIICSMGLDGNVGSDYAGTNLKARVPLNKMESSASHGFSFDLLTEVRKGWNVIPEIALPFVCWAGFSECYLLGCDCTNDGYFYGDSTRGAEFQAVLPNAMNCYRAIAETPGLPTAIYNATDGGRLECFPRINYEDTIHVGIQPSDLLVIGYYTPDADYRVRAENMKASVEAQGLECEIRERPSMARYIGNRPVEKPLPWVLNCGQKADFIAEMMAEYPDRFLLYLDADAQMEKRPALFFDHPVNYDFAVSYLDNEFVTNELTSNTMFFSPTPETKALVVLWATAQKVESNKALMGKYPPPFRAAWDQRVLQNVVEAKVVPGLVVKRLPYEYAKITLTPRGNELMKGVRPEDIVISQHQASRENKRFV